MKIPIIYGEIGTRIRARRQQLGKTQGDLAKLVNLSRPSLANIEGGRQAILVHQLCLISQMLDLPVHDLLPENRTTDATHAFKMPVGISQSQELQLRAFLTTSSVRSTAATKSARGSKG
jgi:transcriptional regulator with XRE-family HTH domain